MALALCSLPAPGSLQQLVIIQRHGERERLFKHQNLSESGAALTAGGLKHISRVGVALRTRFLTPETCGSRCLLGELGRGRWAAHELHAESTGLARTLGTAEVMLRSLVPPDVRGELPIPVYSRPDADDFLLRGYAGGKCPMLTARINEFRASARFGAKEDATREYATLLTLTLTLARRAPPVLSLSAAQLLRYTLLVASSPPPPPPSPPPPPPLLALPGCASRWGARCPATGPCRWSTVVRCGCAICGTRTTRSRRPRRPS